MREWTLCCLKLWWPFFQSSASHPCYIKRTNCSLDWAPSEKFSILSSWNGILVHFYAWRLYQQDVQHTNGATLLGILALRGASLALGVVFNSFILKWHCGAYISRMLSPQQQCLVFSPSGVHDACLALGCTCPVYRWPCLYTVIRHEDRT